MISHLSGRPEWIRKRRDPRVHHADEILFDAILLQYRCDLARDGDVALDAMLILEIGQYRSPTAMDGKIKEAKKYLSEIQAIRKKGLRENYFKRIELS